VVAAVAVLSETLREDATHREIRLFLISYAAVPAIAFSLLIGVVGSLWTIGHHPQLLVWLLILPVLAVPVRPAVRRSVDPTEQGDSRRVT